MPYLAESAVLSPRTAASTDFMRYAYELNGEPLRLLQAGRSWFRHVLSREWSQPGAYALVLGATPWLAQLMDELVERTTVVDRASAMLQLCADEVYRTKRLVSPPETDFRLGDWLALPPDVDGFDFVAGDNAFNFLSYPREWDDLLAVLARRMTDEGLFVTRLLAVPAGHERRTPADIVRGALCGRSPVNLTAVRVALLFSVWNGLTIQPEDALATFEKHRCDFEPVLSTAPNASDNDLLSLEKYRGTGVTYYVPPLADAIWAIERHFRVRSVHFGPYDMSDYFPLIIASRTR